LTRIIENSIAFNNNEHIGQLDYLLGECTVASIIHRVGSLGKNWSFMPEHRKRPWKNNL